jgi:hypothetical protein
MNHTSFVGIKILSLVLPVSIIMKTPLEILLIHDKETRGMKKREYSKSNETFESHVCFHSDGVFH